MKTWYLLFFFAGVACVLILQVHVRNFLKLHFGEYMNKDQIYLQIVWHESRIAGISQAAHNGDKNTAEIRAQSQIVKRAIHNQYNCQYNWQSWRLSIILIVYGHDWRPSINWSINWRNEMDLIFIDGLLIYWPGFWGKSIMWSIFHSEHDLPLCQQAPRWKNQNIDENIDAVIGQKSFIN